MKNYINIYFLLIIKLSIILYPYMFVVRAIFFELNSQYFKKTLLCKFLFPMMCMSNYNQI